MLTEDQNGTSQVDHNLYYNTYGAYFAHVRDAGDWDKLTLSMWQRRLEGLNSITGNEAASFYADPMFVDAPERPVGEHGQFDFRLRDHSPAIDAGGALTHTDGSGSGTTVRLLDARYFGDGMGVTPGDEIQIGGRSPVRITAIDYGGNQITVSQSLSWNAGDAVVLAYNGAAPDLGAYECQGACPPAQPPVVDARVSNGLQALYTFDEGGGSTVHDVSGVGQPLDLGIDDLGAVTWEDGALALDSPAIISSPGAATKINTACQASGELTVEAWIEPDNITQDGPARIVTLSPDTKSRNFTLGQGLLFRDEQPEVFDSRLRTTEQSDNGEPSLWTLDGATTTGLTHLVYTREQAGTARIYVNDELQVRQVVGGDLTGWDASYPLTLGNEPVGERPWLGKLHLVALYCRALSHDEIGQNYAFGLQTCHTLSTDADPPGSGSVSAGPTPNCGAGAYTAGTQVSLTAEPGPGRTFDRWSGDLSGSDNPASLTIDGNKSVSARFAQAEYTLAVSASGGGTVDVDPDQAIYHYGDVVRLTAIPDPDKSFTGWSGDLSGASNPASLTMEGNASVTANFGAAAPGPLVYDGHSIDDDGNGASSGDGDGLAECGETIELTVELHNQGASAATGVHASLSSASPYVNCSGQTSAYPDIAAGGTALSNQPFVCELQPGTPNGHSLTFDLELAAANGGPWYDAFEVVAACGGATGSVHIPVVASSDDAEERSTDGDVALKGDDLELVEDSALQTVGLRFQNVPVPQGAAITGASVEFWADDVQTGAASLVFYGQASDDAAVFSSSAYDISSRSRTAASVSWNDVAPWVAVHEAYQSSDLTPIIQEIVNRPGWSSGHSLALIVTGSGRRTAESYDGADSHGDLSLAPTLHIAYGDPGALSSHDLASDWNLIAPNVETNPATDAETARTEIQSQGGNALQLCAWLSDSDDWLCYDGAPPANNFVLELGQGYFIQADPASAWYRTGTAPSSPLPLQLDPTWTLIGLPKLPAPMSAEDLLEEATSQGGACSDLYRWKDGRWEGHVRDLPFNDFALSNDTGYFVKCASAATYTPGAGGGALGQAADATASAQSQALAPDSASALPQAREPLATPAISDILVTNRRDVAFSVTWRTDGPSTGWIDFGETEALGNSRHQDPSAPLTTGSGLVSHVHQVDLTGLKPETTYHFRVHSGNSVDDNAGALYHVTTTATGLPPLPFLAYGQVQAPGGLPAVSALVRLWLIDANGSLSEPLSASVDGHGYWSINLPVSGCGGLHLKLQAMGQAGGEAEASLPACQVRPSPMIEVVGE